MKHLLPILLLTSCIHEQAMEALEQPTCAQELEEIASHIDSGRYEEADNALIPVLVQEEIYEIEERARLLLLKSRIEFAHDNERQVKFWLAKLHRISPGTELDPLVDPPGLYSLWYEQKKSTH